LVLFAIAPITGSFLGTVVLRLPEGDSLFSPPSHCDHCGHRLRLIDLLPIVNWVLARGGCRYCRAPVSAFYPLIEIASLGVMLWAWTLFSGWQLWLASLFGWLLLAAALIDLRGKSVPRPLVFAVVMAGSALLLFAEGGLATGNLTFGAVIGAGVAITGTLAIRALGEENHGQTSRRPMIALICLGLWLASLYGPALIPPINLT